MHSPLSTELFEETEVVAEEVADVVDAVLLHHDALRSAARTQTYLGANRRLARRIGANRAAMAVAHSCGS